MLKKCLGTLILILSFLLVGCSFKYTEPTTDLDTFQFIITFSSNNVVLLREAAQKYNEKAVLISRSDKDYYNNILYNQCRQWAKLLNEKADMIEEGHLQ